VPFLFSCKIWKCPVRSRNLEGFCPVIGLLFVTAHFLMFVARMYNYEYISKKSGYNMAGKEHWDSLVVEARYNTYRDAEVWGLANAM
jgi:hypothetical protein